MEIQQNIVLTGSFSAPTKPNKIQIINLHLVNNLSPVMASSLLCIHTTFFQFGGRAKHGVPHSILFS